MILRITAWLVLVTTLVLLTPRPITAGEPTDRVRAVIAKSIQILKDPKLKFKDRGKERIDRLRDIVYPIFDFREMAKRSLGFHWRERTPKEQDEIASLFTKLLEKNYANRIESYDDEKVQYTGEIIDQSYAVVDSKIINKKGQEFVIKYKLRLTRKGWKIYDLSVENISIVNNYRAQFNRVIAKSSYKELIGKMKNKIEELEDSEREPND